MGITLKTFRGNDFIIITQSVSNFGPSEPNLKHSRGSRAVISVPEFTIQVKTVSRAVAGAHVTTVYGNDRPGHEFHLVRRQEYDGRNDVLTVAKVTDWDAAAGHVEILQ